MTANDVGRYCPAGFESGYRQGAPTLSAEFLGLCPPLHLSLRCDARWEEIRNDQPGHARGGRTAHPCREVAGAAEQATVKLVIGTTLDSNCRGDVHIACSCCANRTRFRERRSVCTVYDSQAGEARKDGTASSDSIRRPQPSPDTKRGRAFGVRWKQAMTCNQTTSSTSPRFP